MDGKFKTQFETLIEKSKELKKGYGEFQTVLDSKHEQECVGWVTKAVNFIQTICPNSNNAYRKMSEKVAENANGSEINEDVGKLAMILSELKTDIENGLVIIENLNKEGTIND